MRIEAKRVDRGLNDNGPKGFRVEPKMQTRQTKIRSGERGFEDQIWTVKMI
jgi:hypothetical protein